MNENQNPYESAWNRARDEAWATNSRRSWELAAVYADRAAMSSEDSEEIALWNERCDWASGRARDAS